ncbi:MAG: hypothetical protein WDZ63_07345 [Burkholderiales bacterium]
MTWELWQAYAIFAFVAFLLLPTAKLRTNGRIAVLLLVAGAGFVQVGGLPLAAYPRSLLDDLALTTVAWLGYAVLTRTTSIPRVRQAHRIQILVCFALAALLLYPATLGLTYTDPYRLGFEPREMLAVAFLVTTGFWLQRNYLGVALLLVATLGFTVDIKPSGNYWDYLVDPALGLYCWIALLGHGIAATVARFRVATERPTP